MKRLILLRHAKAGPTGAGIEDSARNLVEQGRSDAIRMGQFLREEAGIPEFVLCSAATRTRETLELILPQLGATPVVHYLPELYLARWLMIVNLVRQVREPSDTLLVVAHNPGIEECARKLARPPQDAKARKLLQLLEGDYPTAAVTVFDFDVDQWSAVERGEGDLEAFVRPKDLRGPG